MPEGITHKMMDGTMAKRRIKPEELERRADRRSKISIFHEELRFAKKQQWTVTIATLTLIGAILPIASYLNIVKFWEKVVGVGVALLLAAGGCYLVYRLQCHLRDTRIGIDPADRDAWRRGIEIMWGVKIAMVVGAIVFGALLFLRQDPRAPCFHCLW
jgi:hypothetical protein